MNPIVKSYIDRKSREFLKDVRRGQIKGPLQICYEDGVLTEEDLLFLGAYDTITNISGQYAISQKLRLSRSTSDDLELEEAIRKECRIETSDYFKMSPKDINDRSTKITEKMNHYFRID